MKLLITRPEQASRILSEKLVSDGHEVLCSALLEIVFRDLENLDLQNVQAFVVTSANGLTALVKLTENRDLPLFAVGDKTAKAAKYAGFKTVHSANGDVAALGELIEKKAAPAAGVLVHAGGARLAGDLEKQVLGAGFSYRREILYDANEAETFPETTRAELIAGSLEGILLFSPHTAKVFKRIVDAEGLNTHIEKLDAWCLSSNVAREIDGMGFRRVLIAKRPTEDALLDLIEKNSALKVQDQTNKPDRQREHAVSKTPKQEATPKKSETKKVEPAKTAAASPIPATKVGARIRGSEKPTSAPTSKPFKAVEPVKKSNATRNAAVLFFVFCLGLATWPLILPQVSKILPEQSRNILQGYLGAQSGDKELAAKVVRLEQAVAAASVATSRTEQNLMEISALKTQVEKMSAQTGSSLVGMSDRLSVTEGATKSLSASVETLKSAPMQIVTSAPEVVSASSAEPSAAAAANIAKLEAALANLSTELSKVQRDQVLALTDRADQKSQLGTLSAALQAQASRTLQNNANGDETLILLALGQLHRESRSNQPFSGALQQTLAVAPETMQDDLAALNSVAKTGAATVVELAEEFGKVATDSTQAARLPSSDTWYGKTLHNLASLVKFRRVGDTEGDNVDALVAGAEEKIMIGELAAGVALLKNLDGEPAKAAAPWLKRAERRLQVEMALEQLLTQVTATAVLEKQTTN